MSASGHAFDVDMTEPPGDERENERAKEEDRQAYLDEVAREAEAGVAKVEAMVEDLEASLEERRQMAAEAKRAADEHRAELGRYQNERRDEGE